MQALGDKRTSYGEGGESRRPRFGGGFKPKPVEVGKEYDVTITEVSRRGDGVARIEGFVIFVAGGKRDEKTKIKITSVGPRFANATKVEAKQSTS